MERRVKLEVKPSDFSTCASQTLAYRCVATNQDSNRHCRHEANQKNYTNAAT